jgi:hypothetical protein
MGLMTNSAIAACRTVAVAIVTTETGRHPDMSAVAGYTLAIMRVDVGSQLLFGLLMTTGTYRPMTAHSGEIISDRLMRIMAIDTTVAGKMRIIIGIVAT